VRRATREVRADVGGAGFVFLENPLDPFGHVGAAVHLTTQIAKRVSIETMAMVSNSIADSSAQITESMVTLRGAIAPGFETRLGGARLEAHVGLEVASPGAFVTSSNVYCRHFGVPTDGLGYQACVDGGGLDRTPRRVLVGAYASLGASLDLPEDLYLVARLNYAEYLFASGSSDCGLRKQRTSDVRSGRCSTSSTRPGPHPRSMGGRSRPSPTSCGVTSERLRGRFFGAARHRVG
jgi:hypothetical protein